MRPRPPDIPRAQARGCDCGLVDRLTAVQRGCYADVIVQLVSSTLSDRGMPCLIVWDGSDWPHETRPLISLEDRPPVIEPDPAVQERARGRTVTIFSYDYDNQVKHPIRSGDWLYIQNVHCAFTRDSHYSSFVMHDNARPRYIFRLDLPMADGLFYEKQWKGAIARVASAHPLPPTVPVQHPQQVAAAAATPTATRSAPAPAATPIVATPAAAAARTTPAIERLKKLILDGIAAEGIIVPSSDAELEAMARSTVASVKAALVAATARQMPPVAAPSTTGEESAATAAAAAEAPVVQQADEQPTSSTAVAATAAATPSTTRAAAAAAYAAGPSTRPRRERPAPIEAEESGEEEGTQEGTAMRGRKRVIGASVRAEASSPEKKSPRRRSTEGRTPSEDSPPAKRPLRQLLLDAISRG